MCASGIHRSQFTESEEGRVAQYRAVSGFAVGGLLLSLVSWTALLSPSLWFVPVVAIALCAIGLGKMAASDSTLIGRKAAVAGLFLAVTFAAAAPADWLAHRAFLRAEARRFALDWFGLLTRREVGVAHQLTLAPTMRHAFDDKLWNDYYLSLPQNYRDLKAFVNRPEVHALLDLAQKAEVSYYGTEGYGKDGGRDTVRQVFAVTYEDAGAKKTFLVALVLERFAIPESGRSFWRVSTVENGTPLKPLNIS